jgi:hypothetical protein
VLVQRLIDPLCVDRDGNPVGGQTSEGCGPGQPEFAPIKDIHIGIVTSSLGSHGSDVCVTDPAEMPPRTMNDAAQLLPSKRAGLYSYQNNGFLAWDPRAGLEIVVPDPHPGKSEHETNAQDFVTDFTAHVTATGERGCGYEAPLEAWYRFLIDPEPVSDVTVDPNGQFSLRGPINPVVLQQRAMFLRPDSLLAIVMLTDEDDCSILDENDQQGWLVGRRQPMVRASDACAHPEDPDVYRCCLPCLLLGHGVALPDCDYSRDVACNTPPDPTGGGGDYLTPLEDSVNLRCFDQVRRFGVNLLYPWQRYVDALTSQRITLRDGVGQVVNPIYQPGNDGTPARDPSEVFLVGIVGVPWQDLASEETLSGRALRYLTAEELKASRRWDVILGDPDQGVRPLDPFMIASIDQRVGTNPITGDDIEAARNSINGHEANIVNRDDLQYACTFDLVPDVACTSANQDGCDCNASEQPYARSTCQYAGTSSDGTQTHAKAYPSVRHLQVLRGLGDNAVVASICPKNIVPNGSAIDDPDYGYNPAVGAMIARMKRALDGTCLPAPLETNAEGQLTCRVVEASLPSFDGGCSCELPGRTDVSSATRRAVEEELTFGSYCGGETGIRCDDYCLCEIEGFAGAELQTCRDTETDPMNIYGHCYIDPDNGQGNPSLVARCPANQRRIVRFLGPDVPMPRALTFIACTD